MLRLQVPETALSGEDNHSFPELPDGGQEEAQVMWANAS
jgi:hypothetical protein